MIEKIDSFAAVLLAGGKSERMQTDKRFLPFGHHHLFEHCLQALKNQASLVFINSNTVLPGIEVPCVADQLGGCAGPLDGIRSSLCWLKDSHPQIGFLLSAPVDCPFIPGDFAQQLWQARHGKDVVLAASGGQHHYTCSLWSLNVLPALQHYLESGERALKHFIKQQEITVVEFPIINIDPFFNINEPGDYDYALSYFQGQRF